MNKKSSIKNLLAYIRPYQAYLVICLLMALAVSILELLNPYVIKLAIDDHISIRDRIIYQVEESSHDTIEIQGQNYLLDSSHGNQNRYNILDTMRIKEGPGGFYLEDLDGQGFTDLDQEDFQAIRKKDISAINGLGLTYLFIIIVSFFISYGLNILLNRTGQKIIYNLRNDLYKKIQAMPMSFFDDSSIGRLVTRVNNDTEAINELFTTVLAQSLQDFFTLVGIVLIITRADIRLGFFSFIFVPALVFISLGFRNKLRGIYKRVRKNLSNLNSSFNEYIGGVKTIQIFAKEEKMAKTFDQDNQTYLDTAQEEVWVHSFIRPVVEIIMALAISSLLYIGGNQVLNRTLEIGTLYVFIDYMQRFFRPIFELTERLNIIQSAGTSAERISELLGLESDMEEADKPISLDRVDGRIEFKNVWFSYDGKNWVLKDLSFVVEPSQSVAFVGLTGAGKTTIINLLSRFYDIQKGRITIDGVDIRDIDIYDLRRILGVVFQDIVLFSGDISYNIRLNNENISDQDLVKVAQYVNAHTFIDQLPNKYDQDLKEDKSSLSTGQRQLLSFARTLAYNPDILVLDEATSNIDTQTELVIQDTIARISQDRTTIVIAHRLSTVRTMDKIIVLDQGQIVEQGSHQELLDQEGTYYKMYQLQIK